MCEENKRGSLFSQFTDLIVLFTASLLSFTDFACRNKK